MSRDATSRCIGSQSKLKAASTRTLTEKALDGHWRDRQSPFVSRLLTGRLSTCQLAVSCVCSAESPTPSGQLMVGSFSAYENQSIKGGDSLEICVCYVGDSAHVFQLPTSFVLISKSCELSCNSGAHTSPPLSNAFTILLHNVNFTDSVY